MAKKTNKKAKAVRKAPAAKRTLPSGTKRCCNRFHVGERVLPVKAFGRSWSKSHKDGLKPHCRDCENYTKQVKRWSLKLDRDLMEMAENTPTKRLDFDEIARSVGYETQSYRNEVAAAKREIKKKEKAATKAKVKKAKKK